MTGPTAAPARFPYREHRTMAQVMAEEAPRAAPAPSPSVVALPTPSPPPLAALDGAVQRRCRKCGDWRVSACRYSTCPLARG